MKYRPHSMFGTLDESMEKVVELKDQADLLKHLNQERAWCGVSLEDADVKVEPYGYDERINWDTYLVTIRNVETRSGVLYFGSMPDDYFGAIGYTDGPA